MGGRVPEARGTGAADEFAALLRELKDRSGLSYGALAKRLHMSTSTLHRYCNGTAVPNDYAPVERLARVCKATGQELVEVHRRWILADAARRTRPDQGGAATGAKSAGAVGTSEQAAPLVPGQSGQSDQAGQVGDAGQGGDAKDSDGRDAGDSENRDAGNGKSGGNPGNPANPANPGNGGAGGDDEVLVDLPRRPLPPLRRRSALIASAAAVAVLGAVVLAVTLPSGGDGTRAADGTEAGAPAVTTDTADTPAPSASDSASPSPSGKSPGPSASATEGPAEAAPGASRDGDGKGAAPADGATGAPLNVAVRPYVYEDPCSQHFLVDSGPEQVGPPAGEPDAPRWAAAYGAVSSGEQRVALTLQGTGPNTVVLEELHVRIVGKRAPLAWNDYSMGVGCGGGVGTKSFDIDLDNGSPTVTVKNGQRDFPYKVSESDPEVFYIDARTTAHDVRWELSVKWTSGGRGGTVRVDNDGVPFRTSAGSARPGYDYPLGGGEWIEREG
ncbi:helix-turn-helix domain-containing protein [Streptomyces sp. NPDC059134]|uniref:helix-turn-helix domain-containing protein n=1 Tax=Streptomyces sp. NPDC059134 TaxID=3346738 RepID=UPI0036CD72BE